MLTKIRTCLAALSLLATLAYCVVAQSATVTLRVVDETGASVPGASITLVPTSGTAVKSLTRGDGTFDVPFDFSGTIRIEAEGFARFETTADPMLPREMVLRPSALSATVSVTGSETRIDETAASVTALDRENLDAAAPVTIDDKLRQVPGFSLFRRAGSRTANPTTQGVSLRGIGASGASRALVVADGVPLNDPFGGWIYWGRVPSETVAQIEVLRGPSSDLYGSSAIGGVISIVSRPAGEKPQLSADISFGSEATSMVSAYASGGYHEFVGALGAEAFRTDGFITVDGSARGPVDTAAGVERWALDPSVTWERGGHLRLFARTNFYSEVRGNGTPAQTNDTRLRRFVTGGDLTSDALGKLELRFYGGPQLYHQSFTAVGPGRISETVTRLQTSPARVIGGSAGWAANLGTRNLFTAGVEARRVSGRSDEIAFTSGRPTSEVSSGGKENSIGAYAGVLVPILSRLTLSGGLRFDHWLESSGYSSTRPLATGVAAERHFADRSESAVSPRVSAIYKLFERVSVFGSYSTGFRQPTLNELYRSFRVGDVLTLANETLKAERSRNLEGGIGLSGFDRRVSVRSSIFCTSLTRPVTNLTLSVTQTLITRQRQNLGKTRSCGLETDAEFRPVSAWTVSAGYLFVNSRVSEFAPDPALEGLRIPQVARQQFSAQVRYSDPKTLNFGIQFRAAGRQFDDDQNRLALGAYSTLDATVSRRVNNFIEIYAAVENALDTPIESGRTPVLTLSGPRTIRGGLKLRFR